MQNSNKPMQAAEQEHSSPETDGSIKLLQAEMLLNVSKTVAAFETLDEMLAALVDMNNRCDGCRSRHHLPK